jgi:hypothetical protein
VSGDPAGRLRGPKESEGGIWGRERSLSGPRLDLAEDGDKGEAPDREGSAWSFLRACSSRRVSSK